MLIAVALMSFAAVLVCAIVCGDLLALAERPDGSTSFDSSITSWVVAHRAQGLTTLARWCSVLGSQAILLPLVGIVTLALVGRRLFVLAGLLFVAWAGAIGLYSLGKYFVDRHRPPAEIWLTGASGSSFPSGHATQSLSTSFALVLVGAVWLPRARRAGIVLALLLAGAIGWSRVYLGVHWATDVAAGWLVAAAWIAIVTGLAQIAKSIQQRAGSSEAERRVSGVSHSDSQALQRADRGADSEAGSQRPRDA
jgi:membrane-associated phospholipid phosphatase